MQSLYRKVTDRIERRVGDDSDLSETGSNNEVSNDDFDRLLGSEEPEQPRRGKAVTNRRHEI